MNKKQILYYKNILGAVSSRASCNRAIVGAILVRNRSIISTGYNGSPRGLQHCDDIGHLISNNHCVRTIHAEVNAILCAARNGININGCELYSSYKPCFQCMKIIINSGIKRVFYFNDYKDDFQKEFEKNKYCKFIKIKCVE